MIVTLSELAGGGSEAMLMKWFAENGDLVKKDEPLYMIEYRKITTTVKSPATGRFKKLASVGDSVKVGEAIAEITEE